MGLGAYKKLFPEEWGLIRAGRLIGHLRCMSMAKLFPFIQYRVQQKHFQPYMFCYFSMKLLKTPYICF